MRKIRVTSPNSTSRRVVVLLCVIALAAGSISAFIYFTRDSGVPSGDVHGINYDPPRYDEKQAAEQEKLTRSDSQKDTPPPQSPPPDKVIISAATYDTNNSTITIKTELRGSGWQSCKLTATKPGSEEVSVTANVLYQETFSTCLGFSLAASQLDSPGQWTFVLSATNNMDSTVTSSPVAVMVNK